MTLEKMVLESNTAQEEHFVNFACKTDKAYRFKKENRKNEFNVRPEFYILMHILVIWIKRKFFQ